MRKFFSSDNPVFVGLNKIADVMFVSVLWLLFSIPIFTIGASSSALYYCVTKGIRKEQGYLWKDFFSGFKSNFKQSTLIWILYVLLLYLLYIDINIMKTAESTFATVLIYILVFSMVALTAVMLYCLAYAARFVQKFKIIIYNSARLAISHFPFTILLLLIFAGAVFAAYITLLSLIIIPGLAALLDSFILEKIFMLYMSEEDRQREEDSYQV